MKILVWNDKHSEVLVWARTLKEEMRAWLYIFRQMDAMFYFFDLEGDQADAYKAAHSGNAEAAQRLLEMRCDYQYERVLEKYPVEP